MNKPRKNIVIFSFKLVVFVFILGVIINFFLIPFASDVGTDTRYLRSLKKVEKNDYDIFFFGNSYSFTALDPLTIKERIDLNAIHLSAGAQRLEATVAVANEVINKYNPRFIFFDVSGPLPKKMLRIFGIIKPWDCKKQPCHLIKLKRSLISTLLKNIESIMLQHFLKN